MRTALLLVLAALMVAGCGRRGSPDRPPLDGPQKPIDPRNPDGRQVPDNDFILDPLVK